MRSDGDAVTVGRGVHWSCSGHCPHDAPNVPVPLAAIRNATVCAPGQVTVPAVKSMSKRSLANRPPGALSRGTLVIAVAPIRWRRGCPGPGRRAAGRRAEVYGDAAYGSGANVAKLEKTGACKAWVGGSPRATSVTKSDANQERGREGVHRYAGAVHDRDADLDWVAKAAAVNRRMLHARVRRRPADPDHRP